MFHERQNTLRSAAGRRRSRGGQTLVESALVLPMVILFIFGLFEYGRFLMTMHLVNNAAREACRYAVAHTQPVIIAGVTYGNSTTDVTNVYDKFMAGQRLSSQSVTVYLSNTVGTNIGTWTNATT
ncbi:MAG: TadE/TadG family type IV pilus assembly protein, partial [Pirellulales bacterium]